MIDEPAFRELYRRYGPAVRVRCRAMCGNDADADDALQDAFLRAWRARARFDGRHPLAWLQTIARTAALDLLRRRRPWQDDARLWLGAPDPSPPDPRARADAAKLLDALGPEDAAMLRLRHAEDWHVDEIADHFGCSRRTASRRLERLEHRARALLRVEEI